MVISPTLDFRDLDVVDREGALDEVVIANVGSALIERDGVYCIWPASASRTPLPGSEDHKNLYLRGVPMDPDMNNYDLEHACTAHPLMSKEAWQRAYDDSWARFYSEEHVATIMRRAAATGISKTKIFDAVAVFSGAARIEGVHPLQFGFVRRKVRTQRRSGMPIVNPLLFYPWRAFDFLRVAYRWLSLVRRYRRIQARVEADPETAHYMDGALAPTASGTEDHLVQVFADKIPKTHGAPVREAVAAQ